MHRILASTTSSSSINKARASFSRFTILLRVARTAASVARSASPPSQVEAQTVPRRSEGRSEGASQCVFLVAHSSVVRPLSAQVLKRVGWVATPHPNEVP